MTTQLDDLAIAPADPRACEAVADATPDDPRLNVLKYLAALRRDRDAIITDHGTALDFCLAMISHTETTSLASAARALLAGLDADMRDYAVSSGYALLIGDDRRKTLSAYFTPPILATATLDALTPYLTLDAMQSILDPACGGGSFLVPVARRLIDLLLARGDDAASACAQVVGRLQGIEVDSGLAALSSHLLGQMILRTYDVEVDTRRTVRCADTLATRLERQFDLIIGNPPYSKVGRSGLDQMIDQAGLADLGGHTNLYGLFVLKALDALRPGGCLAFVLPTSFAAGPYFAGLRQEIRARARVVELAMHQQREDLFIDATQDVCLLVLQRHGDDVTDDHSYTLAWIDADGQRTSLGTASAPSDGEPWHLPVEPAANAPARHHQLIGIRVASTIESFGYRIRVGKVVPTRERAALYAEAGAGRVPVLWASDIRADGSFCFQAGKRTAAAAWYQPADLEKAPYLSRGRAVLVQRTSNRDQSRRLNAAPITETFIRMHRRYGFAAENHVIVIEPTSAAPAVSQELLSRILNSELVNARFSAVSGGFNVSAKLLARLALPPADILAGIGDAFESELAAAFADIDGILVAPASTEKSGAAPVQFPRARRRAISK